MRRNQIRHAIFALCTTLLFVFVVVSSGCRPGQRRTGLTDEEEEALYSLVGEPCAVGDYTTTIRRADSLLADPALVGMSDLLRASLMLERDVALLESGDLEACARYADTIIRFGRATATPAAIVQGLQNRGIVSRRAGDYDSAIADYSEALAIAVQEQDADMEQTLSEMLAIACAERSRYEEAEDFGRRALDIAAGAGDSIGVLNAVSTLGGIMVRKGDYSHAIAELIPYYPQAMCERPVMQVKYLTPILWSYLRLDSIERVRETLDQIYKALEGFPRMSQPYLVAVNGEAFLAAREGRYEDQWRWLALSDSIGNMGSADHELLEQRATCLAHLGRYAEAYETECRAVMALDSLRQEKADRDLSELSVKYNTLSKENAIVSLRAQRLTWAVVALSAVTAVLVISVVSVIARRRSMRRHDRERLEEYTRGLEEGYQNIARELHDDIAGTLLVIQMRLATGSVAEAVGQVARRVRRLSHELMPQVFDRIPFTQMLLDFVAEVNSSSTGTHITLTDEGTFDWDTLTSHESYQLYRIIQESVNNALRHGAGTAIVITLDGSPAVGYRLSVANPVASGSPVTPGTHGAGLRSIRARASVLGAVCSAGIMNDHFTVTITQKP